MNDELPLCRIKGTSYNVIVQNEDNLELSFMRIWNPSVDGKLVPLNIDLRYVLLRNSSGFYTYAIFEHLKEWPAFSFGVARLVFILSKDKFRYMAISDERQRDMPLPEDRAPDRAESLAYKEAVKLLKPMEHEFEGEVDDKYQYSVESKDLKVHGWISTDERATGFWQITPSNEYRSGGPLKQELTSHVGPTCLTVFLSQHYVGDALEVKVIANEPWKKVYGPVFIYLNSALTRDAKSQLWQDAKRQMKTEVQSWPYGFPASEDFPKRSQRGSVTGRLSVLDGFVNSAPIPARDAYVGLALPGNAGSWQAESKGYQFWTVTNDEGIFAITGVRPGTYNLYAWVPGFIGDYVYNAAINVTADSPVEVGNLVYEPPRDGPTLWEIGIPDRSAAEFFIPDPNPNYINKLYVNDNNNKFRQYGLWERYAELYPNGDLVYDVSTSDYRKDWFFAQVTRRVGNNFEATNWKIKFRLDRVDRSKTYKLRVALASESLSDLQVRINDENSNLPMFSTGVIGKDNAIARHGIHGLYYLFNFDVPGTSLVAGDNTIFLRQRRGGSLFIGIMYDYIRFEGPPS
ncbi:rhamnogalacturonate lyase B-like isoform X1 [Tripterygium wilfordii]|uniref:Rhamnogalacturonate lyase B-like isoform X1 n=1 Tax=Tripterygium wilfordii TaxID=458696 RepID=A0A7J7D196_TRIWF|nr:probable rhamnogalacturonate lyase B [Tripterygium wilfordii]KAF5740132.1 rhamnogalacturonate lyase B-like isoform X1 [Tripterygium wilfordii]